MQTGAQVTGPTLAVPQRALNSRSRGRYARIGAVSALVFGFLLGVIAGVSTVGFTVLWPWAEPGYANSPDDAASHVPDGNVRLLRSVLLTVHDANRTGNYAVLHALSSPAFQSVNSAERLAQIFANLRESRADLSFIANTRPIWSVPPHVDAAGIFWLKGSFPEVTFVTRFALAFERVGSDWRLVEIGIARD